MGRPDELRDRLQRFCSSQVGREVTISALTRLSGGASREIWTFAVPELGDRLVLRRDPPGAPAQSDRHTEVQLLIAAAEAGVPVPEVVWTPGPEDIGSAGFIMRHIEGETIPRRILRDAGFAVARPKMAEQCGHILAHIHSIAPEGIDGMTAPRSNPAEVVLEQYASLLDSLGEPHPAFELALRWLGRRTPSSARVTVVHGDFRIGNFMVGPEGIRAVLDWELAHAGDPWEDLAWLCTRSWRFGGSGEVGGFGDREELYAAYRSESGIEVDRDAVHWWEVMSNVKWGVMTIVQAFTHLWGHVRSLELAAIGRRTVETEHDVLELIG